MKRIKKTTLASLLMAVFIGSFIGSAQASDYYFFSPMPGLISGESTYPFCEGEDCTYINENGVFLSFDTDYLTAGIADANVAQAITFYEGANGAELSIAVSDSNIISAESIIIAGDNSSITLPSFAIGGRVNITLTAREGTDVVARDTLELFVSNYGDSFVTTWEITEADVGIEMVMPTTSGYTYNGSINWDYTGTGTSEPFVSYDDGALKHDYDTAGTYTVVVEGTFEALKEKYFAPQIKTVENLGKVGWKTFKHAFSNTCENDDTILESFTAGNSDASGVTDISNMLWAVL